MDYGLVCFAVRLATAAGSSYREIQMPDVPATRPSLLVRLRDARDGEAWRQFAELYAPLVYRFARRRGLQDADAADVTQEVLRAVAAAVGRLAYDPRLGSFRGWLFTVAYRKLHTFHEGRRRQGQGSGDPATQQMLEAVPAREEAARWEEEWRRQQFAWAAAQARQDFQEATWQAFWRTAVEGRPAAAVAAELGISVGAVYVAKSRVQARLRELVQESEAE